MITFLLIKAEVGQRACPEQAQMVKNIKKKPKRQFSSKWQEYGVAIAWSSFFVVDFIATAPSHNIFFNISDGEIKGLPISRHK